ncbi:hypothetical protein F5887DRAFT_981228 [Amanita rubescens]|nr:hypothetical protein F5887DRAFT_981228 [Amanita rubescens]
MARIVELSQLPSNHYGVYYTEEDNTNIRHLIAEHQTTVDVLDVELERLTRINAELLEKRSNHFNLIQRGKFALAPHSKLPLEIVREIILHASCRITIPFKLKRSDTPKNNRKIMPTQVILKIALSNPQLWRSFRINTCFEPSDITLKMALELFSRARGSPLRVRATKLSPQAFQAIIMPNQFSKLKLKLSEEQLLQFYQLPTDACVNLEVLSLHIPYLEALDARFVDFHPDKYPRLKSLIMFLRDGPAMRIFAVPSRQLTTLHLGSIYASQLHMLRQCVSLEECKLRVTSDSSIYSGIGEIHLPCLLRFRVSGHHSLLRVFRLPNLEEFNGDRLMFSFTEDDQKLMLEHYNLLRIRVLILPHWSANIDFDALFKHAPSLESVSLPKPIDKTSMYELATGSLGPLLRDIKTRYNCTCEEILAFAETRWECVAASNASGSSAKIVPFERIKFKATDSPTPDHLERRKALQNRGTDIEWEIPRVLLDSRLGNFQLESFHH